MSLPWTTFALIVFVLMILVTAASVLFVWLNGRRNRRKTPVRLARRRLEPERHPVPSREPQPTSEDHELVEEFLRSLDQR